MKSILLGSLSVTAALLGGLIMFAFMFEFAIFLAHNLFVLEHSAFYSIFKAAWFTLTSFLFGALLLIPSLWYLYNIPMKLVDEVFSKRSMSSL